MASPYASPSRSAMTSAAPSVGPSSPTGAKVCFPSSQSPVLASGMAPRPFTHAPYLATGHIIASDELEAVELGVYTGGADGRRNVPGSPGFMGSFNASHNTSNSMHGLATMKKNICRHFMSGNCNRGSSCRFYHPGSIHRVITPAHTRTPTQRPLTPLADLAHQNSSSFATASPLKSPNVDAVATSTVPPPVQPALVVSALGVNVSHTGPDVFGSPLESPSASAQCGMGFAEALMSTTPALTSPFSGQQFSPCNSFTSRSRRGPELNPLPVLQLPDCMQEGGSEDGTHDSGCGSGVAVPGERVAAVFSVKSPSSPGPYRMPIYRATTRPNASARSGRTESVDGLPSLQYSQSPQHLNFGVSAVVERSTSPVTGTTTRNNPYAYSPTAVARQPGQLLSPLKRQSNTQ